MKRRISRKLMAFLTAVAMMAGLFWEMPVRAQTEESQEIPDGYYKFDTLEGWYHYAQDTYHDYAEWRDNQGVVYRIMKKNDQGKLEPVENKNYFLDKNSRSDDESAGTDHEQYYAKTVYYNNSLYSYGDSNSYVDFGMWVGADMKTPVDLVIPEKITIPNVYAEGEESECIVAGIEDYFCNSAIPQNVVRSIEFPEVDGFTIGQSAFSSLSLLEEITIPKGCQSIGDNAFYGCEKLAKVDMSASDVETIGPEVFLGCRNLSEVKLSDKLQSIGNKAFMNTALKNIEIPVSVTSIGDSVFYGASGYSISPDDSDTQYGSTLEKITVAEGNQIFSVDSAGMLIETKESEDKTVTRIVASPKSPVLSDGVLTIGADYELCNYLFVGVDIREVIFEGAVKTVPQYLFWNCKNLEKVTFKGDVNEIDNAAFKGCTNLVQVVFEGTVKDIEPEAFMNCGFKKFRIPAGCTYIANRASNYYYEGAFKNCNSLEEIEVDEYVSSDDTARPAIDGRTFSECPKFERITVLPADTEAPAGAKYHYVAGEDGALYREKIEDQSKALAVWPIGKTAAGVVFAEGTESIADYAFYGAPVQKIELPENGLEKIGKEAFCESEVTEFIGSVGSVENEAFHSCEKLTKVVFLERESGTDIGYEAFWYCTALKELVLPNTIKSIGGRAFSNCESLEELKLPGTEVKEGESVLYTEMSARSFEGCKSLTEVVIPKQITKINEDIFYESGDHITTIRIENPNLAVKEYGGSIKDNYVHVNAFYGSHVSSRCNFFVKAGSTTEESIKSIIANYNAENSTSPRVEWKIRHDDDLIVKFYPDADSETPTVTLYAVEGQTLGEAGYDETVVSVYCPEGKLFDGWFTKAEGGEKIDANTVVRENMNFYPHFSDDPDYDPGKIGYINLCGSTEDDYLWNSFYYGVEASDHGNKCKSKDGSMTFDPDTGTITFNGVKASDKTLIIDGMSSVTINLIGKNEIRYIQKLHEGTLRIEGTGILDMNASVGSESDFGLARISVENGLSIGPDATVALEKITGAESVIEYGVENGITYEGKVSEELSIEKIEPKENYEVTKYCVTNNKISFLPKNSGNEPTVTEQPSPEPIRTEQPVTAPTTDPTGTGQSAALPVATVSPIEPTPVVESSATEQTTAPTDTSTTATKVKEGTEETDKKTGAVYVVTEISGNKVEVEYHAPKKIKGKSVKIPSTVTINGVKAKVTSIANNAFANNKTITSVTIASTVKTIGSGAFKKCTKLKNITIPKNVTEVKKSAFEGCKGVKKITIKSAKLKKIGKNAFKNVPKSTTIKVPKKQKKTYKKLLKKAGFKGKVK